ncbi:RAB11FIP1_2_5 [Lepeophtheirus salmonis]|uniref:RAB11FIP1_2_5 n=1 Tax=Lepeophtheirus salmonis TaxID=72036 RepID=A0A7R8CWK6_LEPSM|nr:RAB11FIP1_2_5 [Lepeophtheirus salmonis]CAF2922019.1 RAB11FIP1_2_5 [Lepeophtheirus salmonis]
MWSPTHVQVLVKRAKGLILKGKNNSNDAFVTIALGKEKYQTSVKKKVTDQPEWCEQCELVIPTQGNTAEIVLTVLHQNFLGVDEFLGMVTLPLKDFDVHERPKTRWYSLKCKPGQTKTDYRGELESLKKWKKVNEKAKKSLSKANLKQHPSEDSLSNKFHFVDDFGTGLGTRDSFARNSGGGFSNRDPGVNSDEDEEEENQCEVNDIIPEEEDMFRFDQLSYKSSGSSLNVGPKQNLVVSKNTTPITGSLEKIFKRVLLVVEEAQKDLYPAVVNSKTIKEESPVLDEWEAKLLGKKKNKGAVPYQNNKKDEDDFNDTISLSQISQTSLTSSTFDKPRSSLTTPITEKKLVFILKTLTLGWCIESKKGIKIYYLMQLKFGRLLKRLQVEGRRSYPCLQTLRAVQVQDSPSSPIDYSSGKPSKGGVENEEFEEKKKKSSSGLKKLKSSYRSLVDSGKTGSLFNLNQLNSSSTASTKTFKDKEKDSSNESISGLSKHSRTHSDGSGVRISKETWDRFDGKSREDLIEMVIGLQSSVDCQNRKLSDMEDYIDSLLMKVIATAPSLLQKEPDSLGGTSGGLLKGSAGMMRSSGVKANDFSNKDAQCHLL